MARSGTKVTTIPNGQSLSPSIAMEGADLVAIQMPAAWTAAALTFQGSYDNVTFANIFDDTGAAGAEVSVGTAQGQYTILGTVTKLLRGLRFIKVRSGPSGAAVNQGADRQLVLITIETNPN